MHIITRHLLNICKTNNKLYWKICLTQVGWTYSAQISNVIIITHHYLQYLPTCILCLSVHNFMQCLFCYQHYYSFNSQNDMSKKSVLACFIAISPIWAECRRMFSRKSFRSDIDAFFILSRIFGIVSHMACENRYLLTRGKYVCSNCSSVFSAG